MTDVPVPQFVTIDPAQALRECINFVEQHPLREGAPVEPDQFERLIIDLLVYRETLTLHQVQEAGLQTLVPFSHYPMIDHQAVLVGATRLPASSAKVPLVFTFEEPLEEPLLISVGTRVASADRKVVFTVDDNVELEAGVESVTVPSTCTAAGTRGNGYAPGQISVLLDSLSVTATVENEVETGGGLPSETTERLRERVPETVRGLSVAGPGVAYRALAKAQHPDIIDVDVESPEPGRITLTLLGQSGEVDGSIVTLIEEYFDDDDVSPFDAVTAQSAEPVDYAIEAQLTVKKTHASSEDQAAVLLAAEQRALAYATELESALRLAPDISQIYARLAGAGIFSVALIEPAAPPEVLRHQFAQATSITISVTGVQE